MESSSGQYDDILSVNGEVYVSDRDNHRIQVFDQEGLNFVQSFEVKNTSTQELCASLWYLCWSRWTAVCSMC